MDISCSGFYVGKTNTGGSCPYKAKWVYESIMTKSGKEHLCGIHAKGKNKIEELKL